VHHEPLGADGALLGGADGGVPVRGFFKLLTTAAFIAFVWWGFWGTDRAECWLKGREYMEARGGSCD
jgi:hypothetical protein